MVVTLYSSSTTSKKDIRFIILRKHKNFSPGYQKCAFIVNENVMNGHWRHNIKASNTCHERVLRKQGCCRNFLLSVAV